MTKRARRAAASKLPLILIVDDDEDNRTLYAEYLRFTGGYRVATATDGKEAVAIARAEQPSVIIMDLSLPILDGWQATRQLKSDPRTDAIPIIALTGHGEVHYRERAAEAGVEHFVLKPCVPSDLARIVASYVGIPAALPRKEPV